MAIAREEVFGLVVVALTFETLDEAIELANSTSYGLSASVWSRDLDTAIGVGRWVRADTIWIRAFMDESPELPSADTGRLASAANSAATRSRTTPKKRVPRRHRPADELVAPAWSIADLRNREPVSGFWIRRRTASGGRTSREGRQ